MFFNLNPPFIIVVFCRIKMIKIFFTSLAVVLSIFLFIYAKHESFIWMSFFFHLNRRHHRVRINVSRWEWEFTMFLAFRCLQKEKKIFLSFPLVRWDSIDMRWCGTLKGLVGWLNNRNVREILCQQFFIAHHIPQHCVSENFVVCKQFADVSVSSSNLQCYCDVERAWEGS